MTLTARVQNGRYVIDERAQLPEGAEVTLQVLDGDDLDDEERARLHAALEEAFDDIDAGRVITEALESFAVRRLEVAARAQGDIERFGSWWLDNRDKAPELFDQELAIAYWAIQTQPEYGQHSTWVIL